MEPDAVGDRRKIAPIWAAVWSGMPWPVVRIVQGCCCPGSARRKGRTQKSESVRGFVGRVEMAGGSLKKFLACRQNRALSFLAGKCQKTCKGMPGRGGGVIYPRGCRDEEPSLTIASSLASTVRGCGEGAAHDSGRHGVAIRGAWRRPGSQERQAGGYGVEFWPLVAGAACRQDHERVKGKLLPVVVAVGSIAR